MTEPYESLTINPTIKEGKYVKFCGWCNLYYLKYSLPCHICADLSEGDKFRMLVRTVVERAKENGDKRTSKALP